MSDARPLKRQHGLNTERFAEELLVYDVDRHKAHSLNAIAARVWEACDGVSTAPEIAARLAAAGVADVDETVVLEALAELDRAHLLDAPVDKSGVADPSRRSALVKLGWAAGIPLVTSIAVPKPAFAQTTGPNSSTGSLKRQANRGGSSGPAR